MVVAEVLQSIDRYLGAGDLQAAEKAARDLSKELRKGGAAADGLGPAQVAALLLGLDQLQDRLADAKGTIG